MTFRLGLTGSIGMGKSTTAAMFTDAGLPVWDADSAVHRLYQPGGAAVAQISALCPAATTNGNVSRETLKVAIAADPNMLTKLEAIVHPLVAADRAKFIAQTTADIAILDIPLLFEKSSQHEFHATLLVTAPADLQRTRVLQRPGMTEQHFQTMLARQMPDAEKRALATHIVETLDLSATQAYVKVLIAHIRARHA
ncbi:dephospho-CoA kinase [Cypionkella aquatica]|uniref:Dephospho-CoA kinase n=1 Tax=Cypionkella aquatica TaxID=1756042 RepID=A0AA37TRY5_9RHOB|nr:dephospho-CoA kinase [Cypionkella aquatica]GLS86248.1 dephospho-CoA kinase [Cypionkella aquatica]